jgi:NADH-quinone oxidoreductase subunit L
MTGPLIVLAIASVAAGFFGIMQFVTPLFFPQAEIAPVFAPLAPFKESPWPACLGLAAFFVGLAAAWGLYAKAESDPLPASFAEVCVVLRRKFYFDEIYAELIALTQDALAQCADAVDYFGIKLFVRLIHGFTELTGRGLRLLQTGNLQTYALLFAAGIALVLYFMMQH